MQRPRWTLRRARVLMGTKTLLLAGLVSFIVMAVIVELIAGLDQPVRINRLLAAGMACIPAVFWLGFFYLMDSHEKEPKHLVAGVAVLGTLIAAPLADFVRYQTVPPTSLEVHSLSALSPDRVINAVLILGLTQEMCKYAAVRYTIYLSREFDEPMDGIVYMMACGTGFAVWANYHYLSGNTVLLSVGAAHVVVMTLAHASFAGLLGYVMGRAKFSRRSAPVRGTLLMLGLLGAAVLNGAFSLLDVWVHQTGLAQQPWRAVGYAALGAVGVFTVVWIVTQRLLAASPFRRDA